MTQPPPLQLRELLADTALARDDAFVELTHRVIAVEALARLEQSRAWRACLRDAVTGLTLIGGMVVASLLMLHLTTPSFLLIPTALGVASWAVLHEWSLPGFNGHQETEVIDRP
jgi:hypothetical protein